MVKRKHIFESIVIVETVIIIIVAIFMFAGYPISLMLNGFAPQILRSFMLALMVMKMSIV